MTASKCFMFMYFLLPHWVPATWRSRAQTSIRAELPSGNVPTTRVRRPPHTEQPPFSLYHTLLFSTARMGDYYGLMSAGHFLQRQRKVTICALVQSASGLKVVLVVPLVMSSLTAHRTAPA